MRASLTRSACGAIARCFKTRSLSGEIVSLSAQHIAIRRYDERAGELVVHFPRAGFCCQTSLGRRTSAALAASSK
jgi:hypothetical protein